MRKCDFPQATASLGRHRRHRLLLRTNCCVTSVCRKREADMRTMSVVGGDVSQSCFSLSNLHFPNVFDRKLSVQSNVERIKLIYSYLAACFFSHKLKRYDLVSLLLSCYFIPAQPSVINIYPLWLWSALTNNVFQKTDFGILLKHKYRHTVWPR